MTKTLGERIKKYRLARKISQRKLATLVGVANTTISLIEQDRIEPGVLKVAAIAKALDVTTSDIVGDRK
jgi:transcriptional regulator with XRE-family HTH domain